MPKVVIYTKDICAYCTAAKALMKKKGVAYEEIDVTEDDAKRDWLVRTTGQRTVPQIFIDEKPYGGYTDVAALDRKGELDALLGLA